MATLIGRECWHCVGSFTYGKIVAHDLNDGTAIILMPSGERKTVAAVNLKLTLEDAINEAEENIAYWQRVVNKLESGNYVDENAADPFAYSRSLERRR